MDLKRGILFVVSGPSGAGKSTLIERFLKQDKQSTFSVSYTTREKRENETEGKDYYFVDRDTFLEMIKNDEFLEWETVHENLYGTPKKEVLNALKKGKDIFLDIDVNGALKIKKTYPEACLIFIEPPSREELKKRLTLRGEKKIELRLKRFDKEIEKKHAFDYNIVNDNLEKAYNDFIKIVENVRGLKNGKDNR
ncbi:MAG TPA: guanylate kinase [Syntrophorhabdaceae bacterium]|nr:guanylate kinase [Syntrophorhabdaceae bacterium]HPU29251.1 guanylate kinase [Syntrophorhabdaceae bacterium]